LATCELFRQQDSNADVLLSSEIDYAVVTDSTWRKSISDGTKRAQEFQPTFPGDHFSRTYEGDMRRGWKLAGAPLRDMF